MATHTDNVEWHKGRDAFNAGEARYANPYSPRDDDDCRYARWRKGWSDARDAKAQTAMQAAVAASIRDAGK